MDLGLEPMDPGTLDLGTLDLEPATGGRVENAGLALTRPARAAVGGHHAHRSARHDPQGSSPPAGASPAWPVPACADSGAGSALTWNG